MGYFWDRQWSLPFNSPIDSSFEQRITCYINKLVCVKDKSLKVLCLCLDLLQTLLKKF